MMSPHTTALEYDANRRVQNGAALDHMQLSNCVSNNNLTSVIRACFIQEPQNRSRQWNQNLTKRSARKHSVIQNQTWVLHYCTLCNAHKKVRQQTLAFQHDHFQLKTFNPARFTQSGSTTQILSISCTIYHGINAVITEIVLHHNWGKRTRWLLSETVGMTRDVSDRKQED